MRTLTRLFLLSALACDLLPNAAFGQTYTINTFAGGGSTNNIPGISPNFGAIGGVAVDTVGNIFFPSPDYNIVLRQDAVTGMVTVVAGNGTPGFSGDGGPAGAAQLNSPEAVALDSSGNLYVADTYNFRIRKISNGVITTVAGTGSSGTLGDGGLATAAQLSLPQGLAIDASGNVYISDGLAATVRKITGAVINTVAGGGALSGDGVAAAGAKLLRPVGIAVDAAGTLYIADADDNRVRRVDNGIISTFAGTSSAGFTGDNGPANAARLNEPTSVAVDAAGSVYIADSRNLRVRKVSNGIIFTVAGNGIPGPSGVTGAATSVALTPNFVAVDTKGNLYIVDFAEQIRRVSNGTIATIAGAAAKAPQGDGGPAVDAQLDTPIAVAVDSAGALYIADFLNGRVRKVSNGIISTVAGNGYCVSGAPAALALDYPLCHPSGLAVDSTGALYIADFSGNQVYKVANGILAPVVGTGGQGFGGDDGPAALAQLNQPSGIAVDNADNLYIADSLNNRVRKVANGIITTIAGTGTSGFSGDGGSAAGAQLATPVAVAFDSSGELYISDTGNGRVRTVANGIISTFAGGGIIPSGIDGPARGVILIPRGLAIDRNNNVYISELDTSLIRKVSNGILTTIAGLPFSPGFTGDGGPAFLAQLSAPGGIAVDAAGRVYFTESNIHRVRVLDPVPPSALSVAVAHTGFFHRGSLDATYTVTVSNQAGAGPSFGPITVTQALSTGLTVTSIQGNGWTCDKPTLTCTRTDSLAPGSSFPSITVVNSISPGGTFTSVSDQAFVSGGGSPDATASDTVGIALPGGGPLTCSASSSGTPSLRGEGYTELLADIILVCTGGTLYDNGMMVPTTNLTVYITPTVPITSRLFDASTNSSEALLLIDDPGSAASPAGSGFGTQAPQVLCNKLLSGCGAYVGLSNGYPVALSSAGGSTSAANVYQGVIGQLGANSVTFYGFPVLPPLVAGSQRTFRITNLRIPTIGMANGTQLTAIVSTNPSTVLPIPFSTISLGIVGQQAFVPSVAQPDSSGATKKGSQASSDPVTFQPAVSPGVAPSLNLVFSEGSMDAFKTRVIPISSAPYAAQKTNANPPAQNIPGGNYRNSESGFIFPGLTSGGHIAGLAEYGTRLKAVFTNIPAGVTLYVSGTNNAPAGVIGGTSATSTAVLVSTSAADAASDGADFGTPGAALPLSASYAPVPLTPDPTGVATAVWEVTNSDPASIETLTFTVYINYTPTPANPPQIPYALPQSTEIPGTPVNDVAMSLAPEPGGGAFTRTDGYLPSTSPLPRFDIVYPFDAKFVKITGGPVPALSVNTTGIETYVQGQTGVTFAISVSNAASAAATQGPVTVADVFPSGLTVVSMSGDGWVCSLANRTCSRTDALAAGSAYPDNSVTMNVAANATSPQVNSITVSGGGMPTPAGTTDSITVTACGMTFSPAPPIAALSAAAATGSVTVTDGAGCSWSVSAEPSWIAITSPLDNTGSGTVSYSLTANTTASARGGALTIGGIRFPIVQQPPPVLTLTPAHAASYRQGQAGATITLTVSNKPDAGVTWGPITLTETLPAGLTLVSLAGTGWSCSANVCTNPNGLAPGAGLAPVTVTVNVASNAVSPLANSISVSGGGTLAATVVADSIAVTDCGVTLSPAAPIATLSAAAATGSVTVTTGAGCPWSVASDSSWLTFTSPAGNTGSATVAYSVSANSTAAQRSGALTIGAVPFPVVQQAPPVLSITPGHPGGFVPGQNGSFTLTVTNSASAGVTWGSITVTETLAASLTLVSISGTGWACIANICTSSGVIAPGASAPAITVTVHVASDATSPQSNSTTVSGGGALAPAVVPDSVTLSNCGVTLSPVPPIAALPAAAATGMVNMTTGAGCPWTVASDSPWLTVTSPAGSTGSSTVSYSVAANAAASQRAGALMISGIPFPIVQQPPPILTVTSTHTGNFTQGQTGATYIVTVANTASAGITWGSITLTESLPSGLSLVSMSGTGWSCNTDVCTSVNTIAPGSSMPPIAVTINVAADAPAQLANSVTVSGGGSISTTSTDPTSITTAAASFFTGAVNVGNNIFYLQLSSAAFGYYANLTSSWIYHVDLGYLYFVPANDAARSVYLWDLTSGHWWYTSPANFPYLYDFTLNTWIFYFPDTHNPGHYTTAPRWFANLSNGQQVTM